MEITIYMVIPTLICLAVGAIVCDESAWSRRKKWAIYSQIWLAWFLFLAAVGCVLAVNLPNKELYEAMCIVYFLTALLALPPLAVLGLTCKKLPEPHR